MDKDPHLMPVHKFGVPGKLVTKGGRTYALVTTLFGFDHSFCTRGEEERQHRARLEASGELGTREDLGDRRLGKYFPEVQQVRKEERKKEGEDPDLKRLAFMAGSAVEQPAGNS